MLSRRREKYRRSWRFVRKRAVPYSPPPCGLGDDDAGCDRPDGVAVLHPRTADHGGQNQQEGQSGEDQEEALHCPDVEQQGQDVPRSPDKHDLS